jgi:DNA-binding NarL/FixJ family response regulator
MTTQERYNAIIVDPDNGSRMRLKQAAMTLVQFGDIVGLARLDDALRRMTKSDPWQVIFVSSTFGMEEVAGFIVEAKKCETGQDAAYVRIMKGADQAQASIAASIVQGADGFLFEPYSVESLLEIIRLSTKVKRERSGARERAAFSLMMGDIAKEIDHLAFMLYSQMNILHRLARLKEQCLVFQALGSESLDNYYESVVSSFEGMPLPSASLRRDKAYSGPSAALKKRLEKKMEADRQSQGKGEPGHIVIKKP